MEVQKSILIAASPEDIWPYMVQPDKILQWYLTFKKFEYVGEQQRGAGTKTYVEEKAAGPLMKMHFVVTEWVDNEVLAFQVEPGAGLKVYQQRWSIEPAPSGCKVTVWEEVQLPFGVVGKLIGQVVQRTSEATVERILAKLKTLVEAAEPEMSKALA